MDKRFAYIVVGLLVILYLVGRKTHPEMVEAARSKAVAIWDGKFGSKSGDAASEKDSWEAHRRDVFSGRVAVSKRLAIAKYPSLAVADSEMNIRFVYRYQWMVKENNPRLQSPDWPELLADECAASSHPGGKAVPASKPDAKPRRSEPADAAVATR